MVIRIIADAGGNRLAAICSGANTYNFYLRGGSFGVILAWISWYWIVQNLGGNRVDLRVRRGIQVTCRGRVFVFEARLNGNGPRLFI